MQRPQCFGLSPRGVQELGGASRCCRSDCNATLQSCSRLQPLGLRLGAWPAPVCISVAARHVRAPHPLGARTSLIQGYLCDEKLKAVSGSTLPSAPHTTVAEAQFIAPARTMAVQGGSADGHGSQNNKCSHRQQSNKRNRITLCPGLGLIDPATVEELSWSQMYNRFNCNPMLLDLRPASEFRDSEEHL